MAARVQQPEDATVQGRQFSVSAWDRRQVCARSKMRLRFPKRFYGSQGSPMEGFVRRARVPSLLVVAGVLGMDRGCSAIIEAIGP
ncbi:hypothetical protein IAQ61_001025 [Plenodomus lingam]|uniref:Predicted protein n=1 Tax=Leptosphaeria maculans (strain JN3 / isolate v23.1.3 / race Av1-4-5-6-7-8) TaxID=985895 RepID=E5A2I3_LEPMJ|nr:predicted protein [Plenodomus lingam JN3]KAH9880731.1 hypothetical protein IAQ61_001025 [Plenodomus lingam]CBX97779.1 predicted protein [Plenodomus lingam JN3]